MSDKLSAAEAIEKIKLALDFEYDPPEKRSKPFNELCIREAFDILSRVTDDEPDEPAAVEPVEAKDFPDSPGIWKNLDSDGFLEITHGWPGPQHDELPGRWVKCTVTVPPVKEPELKPEKPKLLLAKVYAEWDWFWHEGGDRWGSVSFGGTGKQSSFSEVDREASDPEALAIYDKEASDG